MLSRFVKKFELDEAIDLDTLGEGAVIGLFSACSGGDTGGMVCGDRDSCDGYRHWTPSDAVAPLFTFSIDSTVVVDASDMDSILSLEDGGAKRKEVDHTAEEMDQQRVLQRAHHLRARPCGCQLKGRHLKQCSLSGEAAKVAAANAKTPSRVSTRLTGLLRKQMKVANEVVASATTMADEMCFEAKLTAANDDYNDGMDECRTTIWGGDAAAMFTGWEGLSAEPDRTDLGLV